MNKQNHKKSGISAIAICLLLIGAFRWLSGTQWEVNTLCAIEAIIYDERIHDDFDSYGPGEHDC